MYSKQLRDIDNTLLLHRPCSCDTLLLLYLKLGFFNIYTEIIRGLCQGVWDVYA